MENPLQGATLGSGGLQGPAVRRLTRAETECDGARDYLQDYRYDALLGRDLSALIAVKNLTQGRKNRQRLERLRRGIPRIGSPITRPAEDGIVGVARLSNHALSEASLSDFIKVTDPIGIDVCEKKIALSSRDRVLVFDAADQRLDSFENPWFATLHSVAFSRDGSRLLVASSGYDTLFELSVESGEVLWEWNSWEHGYSISVAGGTEFRRAGRSSAVSTVEGVELVCVDPSLLGGAGVPIWQRPVHLNGAAYDHDGNILVSLFHNGKAAKIDKQTKDCIELVSDLNKPHAFLPDGAGGYIVTSTGGGDARVLFLDDGYEVKRSVSPSGLFGIRQGFPEAEEWLQYSTSLGSDIYCMVDIHRSSLFLVSPTRRTYRRIGFPRNWALQMAIRVPCDLELPSEGLLTTLR